MDAAEAGDLRHVEATLQSHNSNGFNFSSSFNFLTSLL